MAMSLKEGQAVTELAERLYSFLPGKPHPYADQNLSFPGVAGKLGLGNHWPGGSKQLAITTLLTATLEMERGRFCPLVVSIVQHGMNYRKTKEPITRDEIEQINAIVARIGYKIPELHDPDFLGSLPRAGAKTANDSNKPDKLAIAALREQIMGLTTLDPVNRGFAFEGILKKLFDLHGLSAHGAFRLIGEQIDGSFELDRETYLVEARWRNDLAAISDLLTFSGKVQRKAQWSRGVFVSYAGFSQDGLHAFAQGQQTSIVGMDGLDLYHILSGELDLSDVLRRKIRRAAETNRTFVPVRELFPNLT
jgi:hypothetical protein